MSQLPDQVESHSWHYKLSQTSHKYCPTPEREKGRKERKKGKKNERKEKKSYKDDDSNIKTVTVFFLMKKIVAEI